MDLYRYALILISLSIAAVSVQMRVADCATAVAAGAVSWFMTRGLMGKVRELMLKRKIYGLDLNKKGSEAGEKIIPESMGFAAAISFCMVCLALSPFIKLFQ